MTLNLLQVLSDRDTSPQVAGDLSTARSVDGAPLADLPDITPDLVERLARRLAEAQGEDPAASLWTLRLPLWRYRRSRARTLLAITPVELRALARVLGVEGGSSEGDAVRLQ
ncbi:hypothetical protein [Rubellimicrobium roseum]|uniref:Uncharacterized protein n=1 Tax=Rubellimicrobium roseum TaxID=687525 RepID=A0A5C4ND04_9RHOB|nr:hypothetical protein [Rubellimicrobium roseum]TNC69518.1 hypothetical protein FHG71_14000 [Rubellimicrobium roseum]